VETLVKAAKAHWGWLRSGAHRAASDRTSSIQSLLSSTAPLLAADTASLEKEVWGH
jgi:hypothetical protein